MVGRVLVIGGSGFIGRHVVRAFREAGADVAVLDTAPAPSGSEGAGWIAGSIADEDLVASAARGCTTAVCLANTWRPASPGTDLAEEIDSHVRATVRVAEICERAGMRRFLFASSGGTVYGIEPEPGGGLAETARCVPRTAYGASKLAIEHYLRLLDSRQGMEAISLRISNPYGEGQRATRGQGFVAAAMQHAFEGTPIPIWGDGSVERDFVHVWDVARAFVLAARHEGEPRAVNIGSGTGMSILEMLERIEKATGRRIGRTFQSDRAVDVARNVLDVRRARASLGWAPQVDLDEGLARTASWWRGQKGSG